MKETLKKHKDAILSHIFSKIAFLFLIFSVVAGGYVHDIFPCQMHAALSKNIYARHIIGIILVFCFIMMEGGWDFDYDEQVKYGNDWSSGNVLHTICFAFAIYGGFMLLSKLDLFYSSVVFGLLGLIYLTNTQKNYWHKRGTISDDTNKKLVFAEEIVFAITIIIFIYGFVKYVKFQKIQYGKKFSWTNFFLGKIKCDSD